MVTRVERKTGFALVRKVRTGQAADVATALIDAFKPFRNLVGTITLDRSLEFGHHARINGTIGAKVYFVDFYPSW